MMSTHNNVLVTSDHKRGRDAIAKLRSAYDDAKLDPDSAQRLNEASGFKAAATELIKRFAAKKLTVAEEIEKYFHEVFGLTIDLTGISFPGKPGFFAYMAVPPGLDEDAILSGLMKYFKVGKWWRHWDSPDLSVAAHINRDREQERPEGLYVFSHRGNATPDAEHLEKGYLVALRLRIPFMSLREYLLVTGFQRWKHGDWLDFGEIRTLISSLWQDDELEYGQDVITAGWFPDDHEIFLADTDREEPSSGQGIREVFFG